MQGGTFSNSNIPTHGDVGYTDGYGYIDNINVTPTAGTVVITAKSLNTVTFTVSVSSSEPNAGSVTVTGYANGQLFCANQVDSTTYDIPSCACNNDGNLTIWFNANPVSVGNPASVEVLVNGVLNQTIGGIMTNQGEQPIVATISPCPPSGSTITIRGVNGDSGMSLQYQGTSTTPTGGTGTTGDGTGTTCSHGSCSDEGSYTCAGSESFKCVGGCWTQAGSACDSTTTPGGGTTDGGGINISDIMSQLTTFYNNNKTSCLIGGSVVILLLLLRRRKPPVVAYG